MGLTNSLTEYGTISKIFHWISAAVLIIQIPLGFYLVDMDFGEKRLTIESIHVTLGLSIFYLTLLRLIYKIFNPTPVLQKSVFPFQVKDSLGTFIFKIKFQEPSIDNQTVTLLRNRTFKGMTAYEWQGEVLDCVEFDILERISIIYDGSEVQQNAYKKELYAKDIGLIYYSKTTEDGFFREYILKDRYPMEKVFEKFK